MVAESVEQANDPIYHHVKTLQDEVRQLSQLCGTLSSGGTTDSASSGHPLTSDVRRILERLSTLEESFAVSKQQARAQRSVDLDSELLAANYVRKTDFERTRELVQNINNRLLILAEETHRNETMIEKLRVQLENERDYSRSLEKKLHEAKKEGGYTSSLLSSTSRAGESRGHDSGPPPVRFSAQVSPRGTASSNPYSPRFLHATASSSSNRGDDGIPVVPVVFDTASSTFSSPPNRQGGGTQDAFSSGSYLETYRQRRSQLSPLSAGTSGSGNPSPHAVTNSGGNLSDIVSRLDQNTKRLQHEPSHTKPAWKSFGGGEEAEATKFDPSGATGSPSPAGPYFSATNMPSQSRHVPSSELERLRQELGLSPSSSSKQPEFPKLGGDSPSQSVATSHSGRQRNHHHLDDLLRDLNRA